jgi:uncharacterized membrane protein YeaQ/YmgE (transglycosylase-associated protein family)
MSLVPVIELLPFGLLVGGLARMLAVGKRGGGWVALMLVGAGGGVVGGYFGRSFGMWQDEPPGFATSLLGALVFVVAYRMLSTLRARA